MFGYTHTSITNLYLSWHHRLGYGGRVWREGLYGIQAVCTKGACGGGKRILWPLLALKNGITSWWLLVKPLLVRIYETLVTRPAAIPGLGPWQAEKFPFYILLSYVRIALKHPWGSDRLLSHLQAIHTGVPNGSYEFTYNSMEYVHITSLRVDLQLKGITITILMSSLTTQ